MSHAKPAITAAMNNALPYWRRMNASRPMKANCVAEPITPKMKATKNPLTGQTCSDAGRATIPTKQSPAATSDTRQIRFAHRVLLLRNVWIVRCDIDRWKSPNETQDQRPPPRARVATSWKNELHESYTSERAAVRCIAWLGLGRAARVKTLPLRINASAANQPLGSVFFGALKSMPIKCAVPPQSGHV
jgi:hypothetical protein